jgi:hypothetical protein
MTLSTGYEGILNQFKKAETDREHLIEAVPPIFSDLRKERRASLGAGAELTRVYMPNGPRSVGPASTPTGLGMPNPLIPNQSAV